MEEWNNFPAACKTIIRDFYVNDLLSGSSTAEEIMLLRKESTIDLTPGGFNL